MLGSTTWGWRIEGEEPVEPVEEGVLAGLSLDDKAGLTGGADIWHTVAIDRLGIPSLLLSDGPAGVRGARFSGDESVSVPCGTALAATWDRDLVHQIGVLLGDEARDKDAHLLLAPTVNLHRHPLGGRNFESFSEDPFLTAQLAVAYIRGVQSRGVGCAVKHFVANDQEHDRMQVSVEVDERTLREVYLAPFEAAVREAGVWSVMAAYNRLHGVHCSEHAGLLGGILRREWGFDGVVVSDWYGTHSTAAVAAGLDLEMPGPPRFLGHYLAAAVRQGDLPEPLLDRAAAHLMGLVDRAAAAAEARRAGTIPAPMPAADRTALARRAAAEAVVVLTNDGLLPLQLDRELDLDPASESAGGSDAGRARSPVLAILGPKAERPDIQGGGSAHVQPAAMVTPLDGLVARTGRDGESVTVHHEPGVPRIPAAPLGRRELRVPPRRRGDERTSGPSGQAPEAPRAGSGDTRPAGRRDFSAPARPGEPGLLVEHYAGADIGGEPIHREVVAETQLFWLGPPVPDVSPDIYSVRARGEFTPERTGEWRFTLSSAGTSRALLDGAVVVDNLRPTRGDTFFGRGSTPVAGVATLEAGTTYLLEIELHARASSSTWVSGVALTAHPPDDPEALDRAVAAARDADVAVVVVGGDGTDREGEDRPDLDLPPDQNALVRAVAAVNRATVVVVNSGSPVALDWTDEVGAVVQAWYGGQEAGHGLADVLFGDVDAAGRLPTTLPRRLEDTPAFPYYPGAHGRAPYGEGVFVGYRHYDAHEVEPRFCFGHGLSYTEFAFGELAVGPVGPDGDVVVELDVTNTGGRAGQAVVQLYLRDVEASVARPQQELKGFAKVALAAGETTRAQLVLPGRAFAFWDIVHHAWVVEPGDFEILVGASSRDIRARATLTLEQ